MEGSSPSGSTNKRKEFKMDLIMGLYLAIGLIFGIERLSRVTNEDDSSMVCIGITASIIFWPMYIVYLLNKER